MRDEESEVDLSPVTVKALRLNVYVITTRVTLPIVRQEETQPIVQFGRGYSDERSRVSPSGRSPIPTVQRSIVLYLDHGVPRRCCKPQDIGPFVPELEQAEEPVCDRAIIEAHAK